MLTSALIVSACVNMSPAEVPACQKALEAAGLQTRVTQNIDAAEKVLTDVIHQEVARVTGDTALVVTGTVVRVIKDKALTYPIRRKSMGILPAIRPTLGVDWGKIEMNWSF